MINFFHAFAQNNIGQNESALAICGDFMGRILRRELEFSTKIWDRTGDAIYRIKKKAGMDIPALMIGNFASDLGARD